MATLAKNFSFNTNTTLPYTAESGSWAASAGSVSTTASINSGLDSTNDTNAGGGVLSMATSGKNKSSTNTWTWTGTWENLGVPAGSVVTNINGNYDWWCTAFSTGSSDSVGAMTLLDSGNALQATIISGTTAVAGTTAQATRTGTNQAVPSALQASNSTIKIQITNTTSTGNSASGACTIVHDWIALTVTYTPFQILTPATVNATASVSATLTDVPAPAAPQGSSLYAVPIVDRRQFILGSRLLGSVVTSGGANQLLSATVNATAAVSAAVVKTAVLAPSVSATATVSGAVVKTAVLTPTVNATATVSGAVVKTAVLSPSVSATSTVSGAVVKTAVLTPSVAATATVTGAVTIGVTFSATVNATSTVSGAVVKTAVLAPSVAATSTVTTGLVATKVLSATVNATATVTATLTNSNAPPTPNTSNPALWISSYYYH